MCGWLVWLCFVLFNVCVPKLLQKCPVLVYHIRVKPNDKPQNKTKVKYAVCRSIDNAHSVFKKNTIRVHKTRIYMLLFIAPKPALSVKSSRQHDGINKSLALFMRTVSILIALMIFLFSIYNLSRSIWPAPPFGFCNN